MVLPDEPPRAAEPGPLPPAGPLRLGSIALGTGRPLIARRFDGSRVPTALWAADSVAADVASTWSALAERFPATGLWPLLLTPFYDDANRPWSAGELDPLTEAEVDAVDVEEALATGWHDSLVPINNPWAPGTGPLAPFGPDFPGLAPSQPTRSEFVLAAPAMGRARLGLVSCRRPADAVALAGWQGAINVTSAARISAVLRSWEDRFGVVLAGLGFATMTLLVSRPPTSDDDALRVAAEVAALCPDALWQPESLWPYEERDTTFEDLSHRLVRGHLWRLWFD